MNEMQKKYSAEIEEIAEASRRCAKLGFVASHGGNLSYRVEDDVVLITPTKVAKRKIKFDDICIINMSGKILYANKSSKPTGETPLHTHVFEKRPDIKALVHAHPPILTGLAIAHSDLLMKPILPEPALEIGPVLSMRYEQPLTEELAGAVDDVVLKTNAFLMFNHGIMVMSIESAERALDLLEMIEAMAKSAFIAHSLGTINELSEKDVSNLDNVNRIRNFPCPGAPDYFSGLEEAFFGRK